MSKLLFAVVFPLMIIFTLNSCNSKNTDKTSVEIDSTDNRNERMPRKKFDDKDSADGNQKSHTKKSSPRKKYEFPEVY